MDTKKRKIVLAALICTLAVAVYLNWQFAGGDLTATTSLNGSAKNLGDTKLVNATTSSAEKKDMTYFESARANREKARDEALAILKETINNVKASSEEKASAVTKSAEIASNIETEANIENLIKAKGYSDALAVISNGQITIVVKGDKLSANQLTEIKDIGVSAGQVSAEKIKIIASK